MALDHVDITLMVDDTADPILEAEHGLSMWIETQDHRIVFDTGQGPALAANADRLGINLTQAHTLVLSHGHYDHTGGVAHMLWCNPGIDVFCHPGVVQPRYSVLSDTTSPIHMPRASMAAIDKLPSRRLHWMSEPMRLTDDIGLTGPIPRQSVIEDSGGPFYLDPYARRKDYINDDTALWINTSRGLVVCTGCCHAGLINTLTHVQHLSGVTAIRAVIGGFHLLRARPDRLQWTLSKLEDFSPTSIIACHCTGKKALVAMGEVFNSRVSKGYAGMRLHYR